MDNFDLKKFLVENKLTANSRLQEGEATEVDIEKKIEQLLANTSQKIQAQTATVEPSPKDNEINEEPVTIGVLIVGAPGILNLLGDIVDEIGGLFGSWNLAKQKPTVVGNILHNAGHKLEHKYLESLGGYLQAIFPKRYQGEDVHNNKTKLYDDAHKLYAGMLTAAAVVSGVEAVHAAGSIIGGLEGGATALKTAEVFQIAQKIAAA